METRRTPRPEWLKVRLPAGDSFGHLRRLVREHRLHTVCQDARCPNIGECWAAGTATFMILGDVCTRSCRFCAVRTGRPSGYDPDEPRRIAEAIGGMGVRYAVITSVDRDDLADGGAYVFAETIRRTRATCPEVRIEVLVPDFRGSLDALRSVVEAGPDVLAHNIETVARLYPVARAGARYERSLELLSAAKSFSWRPVTKSSLMLGLGESRDEVLESLADLHRHAVDIVTLGQYLQPTREHLPVRRYYAPQEFEELKSFALSLGFRYVAAGPLVRSSYHAEQQSSALHLFANGR
ncbi:MAG: lipoyl synthase [Acidobacteria bacterium]|nr:lipoyl synthase [Acidobacteriota bacterium]